MRPDTPAKVSSGSPGAPAAGDSDSRPRVGISRCLLGDPVRFDGGHKRNRFVTEMLAAHVQWVTVCPELEAGLGVPREPIRLAGSAGALRLVGSRSGTDHTAAVDAAVARRLDELERLDLCGFVLKKGSPTCGMERVKVCPETGIPNRDGVGRFAAELMRRRPLLPVEEEGRLNDPVLRENFIERVLALRSWKDFKSGRYSVGALVAFHAGRKFQILSHSPRLYRELGRVVARAREAGREATLARYEEDFMRALAEPTTRKRHANVLFHLAGFLRGGLDPERRRETLELIEDYRRGLLPLVVPVTLIRHHARALASGYLLGQIYLDPHPKDLMLRNHV